MAKRKLTSCVITSVHLTYHSVDSFDRYRRFCVVASRNLLMLVGGCTDMGFSASRLTCYAVLSAIEEDLRNICENQLDNIAQPNELLGNETWNKCVARLEREQGIVKTQASLDDLLPYLDFADLYHMLNTHSSSLPPVIRRYFKDITPYLERLAPIRNRVAHSRPLDFEIFLLSWTVQTSSYKGAITNGLTWPIQCVG